MADKTEMAEDRTDWAEDRTVLANERTFAGWMRTGMAAVALALGLRALFGSFEPTWIPKTVASMFILAGIWVFWTAWHNARRTVRRLDQHDTESHSNWRLTLITASLTAGAVATGVILWFL